MSTAAKSKIIKQLLNVYLVRDATTSPAATTLTAAAAAGASTITVAAITGLVANDPIRIGSGEQTELAVVSGTPVGSTVTLAQPLVNSHDSGDAVVRQTAYDLGDVTDGGVAFNVSGQTTDVNVATRRLIFTTITGFVDASMAFTLPSFSLYHLAHATGSLLSLVSGAGTQASPLQLVTDGSDFSGDTNMALVAVGVLNDGSIVRVELWGVDMDFSGLSVQLTRGVLAGIPIKGVGAAGLMASALPSFAVNTSLKASKGKVWDGLTEVGYFNDGSPATTVGTAAAAGATTLLVASGTGITAGAWIRVGSSDTVEYHWVDSVATNTLTLRTRLLRAQAVGTPVVVQTQVPFAGCSTDGVRLNFGSGIEILRSATKRVSIGARPGDVKLTASVGLIEFSMAMLAYALGIPQSAISGGRLPIGNNIGTATLSGLYVRGTLQDGTYCWVNFWGNSIDIAQLNTVLTDNGPPSTIPLSVKPASAIQLLQHP